MDLLIGAIHQHCLGMCTEGLTWSVRSRASRVIIVVPVDTSISVWPDVDCSGDMMLHE